MRNWIESKLHGRKNVFDHEKGVKLMLGMVSETKRARLDLIANHSLRCRESVS